MSRPELEDRLRTAFREQAGTVTADQRPSGRVPATGSAVVHDLGARRAMRARVRRISPLLLAAAVVIIVAAAGATAASVQSDRPAHPHPSGAAVPSASTVSGPSERPTSSARRSVGGIGGTRPAGAGGGAGSGAAGPGAATGAGPTTTSPPAPHRVTLQGVSLTVPGTWQPAGNAPDACLTISGLPYHGAPSGSNDNCQVGVMVRSAAADLSAFDPDSPTPLGSISAVTCDPSQVTTVAAETVSMGGVLATHRVFTAACLGGTYETWIVTSDPVVVLYRYDSNGPATDITTALPGLSLPGARSGLAVVDHVAACTVGDTALSAQHLLGWLTSGAGRDYRRTGTAVTYPLSADTTVTVRTAGGATSMSVADLAQVSAGNTVDGLTPTQLAGSVLTVSGNGSAVTGIVVDTTTAAPPGGCG